MTCKRLTVDVIERRQICFRLGQKVFDRNVACVIIAIEPDRCLVQDRVWRTYRGDWHTKRWFVEYGDLRPRNDGRRYL